MIYGMRGVVELLIKHEVKPSALCRQCDHNPSAISHVKHNLSTLINGLKFASWVLITMAVVRHLLFQVA